MIRLEFVVAGGGVRFLNYFVEDLLLKVAIHGRVI